MGRGGGVAQPAKCETLHKAGAAQAACSPLVRWMSVLSDQLTQVMISPLCLCVAAHDKNVKTSVLGHVCKTG